MSQTAKLFKNGRSQAVRLPAAFRFDTDEVFIRRDAETGDVILSAKPKTWDGFFEALKGVEIPDDFLNPADRRTGQSRPDPFEDWGRVSLYVLDTNTVSYFVRNHPAVSARMTSVPMEVLSISAITEGELLFGLEKKPMATRLHNGLTELLKRLTVLPWDRGAAGHYGRLRAALERGGKGPIGIDLLIAAHAVSVTASWLRRTKRFAGIRRS